MIKGLLTALCLLVLAAPVMAEKVPTNNPPSTTPSAAADCDLTDYKAYREIFDPPQDIVNAGDTASGQVAVADDGTTFEDIIVELDMVHTWVGDLLVTVSYDRECDGAAEAMANVVDQPGVPESTFGCDDDIDGVYLFADKAGLALLGDPCPATPPLPSGCYLSDQQLAVFDGEAKGGCFDLLITDNANGDAGQVRGWAVYALNGPPQVPTVEASWSTIKSIY